jgi:alpha-1,3-mannosyltransferase
MKVLHVTRQFFPAIGGIESVVRNLGRALTARGWEVGVATLDRSWESAERFPRLDYVDGMQVYRFPFLGSPRYAIAPGVLNIVNQYDLVHLHSSDFFLDYLAVTRPIHQKPIVLHTHGLYFHTPYASRAKMIYFNTMTRFALRQVGAVICDSQQDVHLLNSAWEEKKLFLIPNGICQDQHAVARGQRDPALILTVGRLASNKRCHLLLQTFARVQEQIPEVRLALIGKDQGELQGLREMATQLGLDGKVCFLGEVSEEVLREFLRKASVWVSASAYESFGIALLEAMSAGCVPVVQHLEAFEGFIEDQLNGLFTDFSNTETSAGAILRALQMDEGSRTAFTQCGQAVASRFTWERIASQVEDIYVTVLNPTAKGRVDIR